MTKTHLSEVFGSDSLMHVQPLEPELSQVQKSYFPSHNPGTDSPQAVLGSTLTEIHQLLSAEAISCPLTQMGDHKQENMREFDLQN